MWNLNILFGLAQIGKETIFLCDYIDSEYLPPVERTVRPHGISEIQAHQGRAGPSFTTPTVVSGEDCNTACRMKAGLRCVPEWFDFINKCDSLIGVFPCEKGYGPPLASRTLFALPSHFVLAPAIIKVFSPSVKFFTTSPRPQMRFQYGSGYSKLRQRHRQRAFRQMSGDGHGSDVRGLSPEHAATLSMCLTASKLCDCDPSLAQPSR